MEVKSQDEMGILAGSLNTLVADLQEKITALEQLDKTRREFFCPHWISIRALFKSPLQGTY